MKKMLKKISINEKESMENTEKKQKMKKIRSFQEKIELFWKIWMKLEA